MMKFRYIIKVYNRKKHRWYFLSPAIMGGLKPNLNEKKAYRMKSRWTAHMRGKDWVRFYSRDFSKFIVLRIN